MKYESAWCTDNNGYPVFDENVERYISVRPTARQLAFNEMKYYNFIHFGVNTFTNSEWGDGSENERIFNPTYLDTDQWCDVLKSSGSKGIIFTAKHHDGFCLFDSRYTTHSVMYSPYGRDIVRELNKSCKKYDMKLGLYLSPWDRHEKTYGTDEYNDYFVNQLTELCTNYGELFCLWFDGACGEGANGKNQVYDWERYYKVVRKYQHNAVSSISGPDVRWIGNEGGRVRSSEWSVIPWTDKTVEEVAENSQHNMDDAESLQNFDRMDEDLGSREALDNKGDLVWSPAEADVSITSGWFWHDEEYNKNKKNNGVRTPEELSEINFNTVGGNASMLLNVPPDTRGLISNRDIQTLRGFTEIIKNTFAHEEAKDISVLTVLGEERPIDVNNFMLNNDEVGFRIYAKGKIKTIWISEDIKYSQRVERFEVYATGEKISDCTVIGSGKIIKLPSNIDSDVVDIIITQSRSNPVIKCVKIFS